MISSHFSQNELTLLKNYNNMRQLMTIFCAVLLLTSCASTRNNGARGNVSGKDLHPDQVFTITEDDIAQETRQINSALKGEWKYNGPSVDVSGKNVLAGIGKPIAKGKLKKKLHITCDADKLLSLLTLAGNFTDSSTIKALSFLMDHYDDVMVGFELKK